jgi:Xaa-Pro aminopeptidase
MDLAFDPDLSPLDDRLAEADRDGYLIDAAGDDADQRYLSGFDAPDPFVTLYVGGDAAAGGTGSGEGAGDVHLLVSSLEYGRARTESRAAVVDRLADYDWQERVAEYGQRAGKARVYADFLADRDVAAVAVPERFPLGVADGLREQGIDVSAEAGDVVTEIRATKAAPEIDAVRRAQRANEAAIRRAEELIRGSTVGGDRGGDVLYRGGEPLTAERVKEDIEVELLHHGCALDETIVACGADAADPHDRGSGPLRADEPIVVDVFPREKSTGYHADTTRTFLRGSPDETVREWFDVVDEARRSALAAVEPGATGADVHDAACDVIEAAGLPTLRSDPTAETGFVHSTGHGVGLEIHELPKVSPQGGELRAGNVITVEPGLYDPDVGGVRIEDIVVVTDDGSENLTDYPIELVD